MVINLEAGNDLLIFGLRAALLTESNTPDVLYIHAIKP